MDSNLFGIDVSKKAVDSNYEESTPNYKKRVNKKDMSLHNQISNDDIDYVHNPTTDIRISKSIQKSDSNDVRLNDIDLNYESTSDMHKEF